MLTLHQVPQLQRAVLADRQRHLPGGVYAEVVDGVLVSAQDMHALPVVHSPDAQIEILQRFT